MSLHEVQDEIDPLAAVAAGLAGGAAFVVVLEADLRLTGNNVDDLVVLGRLFTRDIGETRRIGLLFHATNAVLLAALYAALRELKMVARCWLVVGVEFLGYVV